MLAFGLRDGEYVVGGGVTALQGLRETRAADLVVRPDAFERLCSEGWWSDERYCEKWGRQRLIRKEFDVFPNMFWNAE